MKMSSPLAVGFLIAGLLMFGVAAIVRNASVPTYAMQNAVVAAVQPIPPPQQAPVAVPTAPLLDDRPMSWLAYRQDIDDAAKRLVWAGGWFSCYDLTTTADYVGIGTEAKAAWQQLTPDDRDAVVAACMADQPESERVP